MCEEKVNLELLDHQGKRFAEVELSEEMTTKLIGIGIMKVLNDHIGNKNNIDFVVFDYPYTHVIFKDGSSERVAPWGEDEFSPELGVMWAIVKNMFGSVGNFQKAVNKWADESDLDSQLKVAMSEEIDSEMEELRSFCRKVLGCERE